MTNATEPKPSTKRPRKMARDPKHDVVASEGSSIAVKTKPSRSPAAPAKRPCKSTLVLTLLQQPEGTTLNQMVEATSWLQHTTRAALTGLKKKGHTITSEKPANGPRIYRIGAAIAATVEAASGWPSRPTSPSPD